jgi:hypothetical protein
MGWDPRKDLKREFENGTKALQKKTEELRNEITKLHQQATKDLPLNEQRKNIERELNRALTDIDRNALKAMRDTANAYDKAIDDVVWNAAKSASDIVDAGKTVGRFVERQFKGQKEILSDGAKRVREGKVVDAVWHLGTDKAKNTNKNMSSAAQENEWVRTAMQSAASFYGGPAGAAAFAAWYTYSASGGNLDMAIRVGVITAATSYGYANTSAMPTDTIAGVAKKAIVTGALGGAAVAASGGDEAAVREAFLKSGGMVVVQSAQSYVAKNYVEPAVERADSYCAAAIGSECPIYVERDPNGDIVLDPQGRPKLKADVTLPQKEKIGQWKAQAEEIEVKSKQFQNGDWMLSWDKDAFTDQKSVIPAVALTYTGRKSPYSIRQDEIREATSQLKPQLRNDQAESSARWILLNAASKSGLEPALKSKANALEAVGHILKIAKSVPVRPDPTELADVTENAKPGTIAVITEVKSIRPAVAGNPGTISTTSQTWIRVEYNDVRANQGLVQQAGTVPPDDRLMESTENGRSKRSARLLACTTPEFGRFHVGPDLVVSFEDGVAQTGTARRDADGVLTVTIDPDGRALQFERTISYQVAKNGDLLNGKARRGSCSVIPLGKITPVDVFGY